MSYMDKKCFRRLLCHHHQGWQRHWRWADSRPPKPCFWPRQKATGMLKASQSLCFPWSLRFQIMSVLSAALRANCSGNKHIKSVDVFVVYLTMLTATWTTKHDIMGRLVNNEMQRKWKEIFVASLKVVIEWFLEGVWEYTKASEHSQSPSQHLNPGHPEY